MQLEKYFGILGAFERRHAPKSSKPAVGAIHGRVLPPGQGRRGRAARSPFQLAIEAAASDRE